MYFPFLLLIFTCIIILFLLLVRKFSGDVAKISKSVASHLPLSASYAALVWARLTFATPDTCKRQLLWFIYQYCWVIVGYLLVDEEVVCLSLIVRVIIVSIGEVILQLLNQLSIYYSVGSTKHCDYEVFTFFNFDRCLLIWICWVCYSR